MIPDTVLAHELKVEEVSVKVVGRVRLVLPKYHLHQCFGY